MNKIIYKGHLNWLLNRYNFGYDENTGNYTIKSQNKNAKIVVNQKSKEMQFIAVKGIDIQDTEFIKMIAKMFKKGEIEIIEEKKNVAK